MKKFFGEKPQPFYIEGGNFFSGVFECMKSSFDFVSIRQVLKKLSFDQIQRLQAFFSDSDPNEILQAMKIDVRFAFETLS